MVIPAARRPNPYGPPPFFGEDDNPYAAPPTPPFLGFEQIAGVGAGAGVGADAALPQQQGVESIFTPQDGVPSPQSAAAPVPPDQPTDDFPTEASIERRTRLAKALLGQQQPVEHWTQALGNAVNQIAGAYHESRAGEDQEKIETRRREAYKKALGGGETDLEKLADDLIASNDPVLVDKGLEIKMQLASGNRRRADRPIVQDFVEGEQTVQKQWDEASGQWVEVGRGPRFARQVAGAGGGGGGDGSAGRRQQGGAFQLPNGDVVAANFNPRDGQYYYQDQGGQMLPVPPGSRPVNPSTGGTQTPAGWLKLKKERQEGINSLRAIDDYAKKAGGLPQGYQRWANDWSAKVKTWLGVQGLSPQEFDQMEASARQQALLGMLRVTIVGPGVMTEQDALRVIEAIGGKVSSALQNPQVLIAVLADIYERKRREVQVLDDEYRRNAPSFGEEPQPLGVPDTITSAPRGGQGNAPKDGDRMQRNGKTYERRNGRWFPA